MPGPMEDRDHRQHRETKRRIGKQIVLPWRKSIEISLKGMQVRMGRSIITMMGIVLAIAFLMNIFTSRAIVRDLRSRGDLEIEFLLQRAGDLGGDAAEETQREIWLVSLSIGVCFVGIVNSMLMSVTERVREIGTMKCLGALDGFIIRLFLLESLFQGAAGTMVGILLGMLVAMFTKGFAYGFGRILGAGMLAEVGISVVLALVIGTALSVMAAIYPAYTAAKMQPVEAMRVEE